MKLISIDWSDVANNTIAGLIVLVVVFIVSTVWAYFKSTRFRHFLDSAARRIRRVLGGVWSIMIRTGHLIKENWRVLVAVWVAVVVGLLSLYLAFGNWLSSVLAAVGIVSFFAVRWLIVHFTSTTRMFADRSNVVTGFAFFDVFDDLVGWERYRGGNCSLSTEMVRTGMFSLKKESPDDPSGVYKKIVPEINLGFIFTGWLFRPSASDGGPGDRLAIENEELNGYGFGISHNQHRIWIERRDNGIPEQIGPAFNFVDTLEDQWYQFKFYAGADGGFKVHLYNRAGIRLYMSQSALDDTYKTFDRVVVHGGSPFYVDELVIKTL